MSKEIEIWKFSAERLHGEDKIILLVVAESSGSSPGRQGFKMIVASDEICGSIGGGVMEVALVELAKGKIKKAESKSGSEIIEQIHQKNSPNSSGMICSGKQTVIVFELNSRHLKDIQKIIQTLKNHQSCRLQISNFEFQILEQLSKNGTQSEDFNFQRTGENEFVYEETIGFKNKLFIIGGGHCALALSELMSKMDFRISLFDDRSELNTLEKNKFVHEKRIIDSYENIGDFVESGANHYVVVMTLGYKFDEIVIRKLFGKNFKYFGVLGSKAKMKVLMKALENEGFDKDRLDKIHTPVGLPINSRTPEEIAVSIAAEIIAVKNSSA